MSAAREDLVASRITDATTHSGVRTPQPRPPSASAGPRRSRSPVRWSAEIYELRDELHAHGRQPHRSRGHGRLFARPRGHHPHLRRRTDRARLDRPRPGAARAERPARDHRARRLVEVGQHRRDRQPEAALREGVHATPASTRRERIVVVTDPGSPLDESARADGYHVFNADPNVGGRYSALTAFGLVPSGLAGVDISALLDEAEATILELVTDNDANPGLVLGAAIAGTNPLRDKLGHRRGRHPHRRVRRLGRAAHRRVHGQAGQGHPARRARPAAPELDREPARRADRAPGRRCRRRAPRRDPARSRSPASSARQMIVWEYAVAVAGRLLGIDPFDQPDVEAAKIATRALLDNRPQPVSPAFVEDGDRGARNDGLSSTERHDLSTRVDALLAAARTDDGYVAIQAYVDRVAHPAARRAPRPARRDVPSARSRSAGAPGSCTRPASSTRAAPRSACSCRSRQTRARRTWRSRIGRSLSASSSRPRRPATRACSPTTAAPC